MGQYPSLRLADARTMAILNKRLLKERKTTVEPLKALASRASDAYELSKLAETTDAASPAQTFDQAYRERYTLQVKANRKTNLSSRRRPIRSYENHVKKQFGNLRIVKIRHPMINKLMQPLILSNTEIATKLLG